MMQGTLNKSVLLQRAARMRAPLSGTFELTPRCNMQCRMCYVRMTAEEQARFGTEKTADEWIAMGAECAQNGTLFLLLTGGEPFLRPDFEQIYTGLRKQGLLLSVNTNGTLLTADRVAFLAADLPTSVNLTLYGASDTTYKKLCGLNDGFQRVLDAIERLKKVGVPLVLNMSFTKANVQDLEKMIALGRSYDLPMRIATYMFPPVRTLFKSCDEDQVRFTPEECGNARFSAMRAQMDSTAFEDTLCRMQQGEFSVLPDEGCEQLPGSGMTCMAGRSAYWVTWDGRMMPCGMMNGIEAYPFQDGFLSAWNLICEKTDAIRMPHACDTCKARGVCKVCAAMCLAETGQSTGKPDYVCQSTKCFLERVNG